MIFSDFKLEGNLPIYIQIKNYLSSLINKGLLPNGSKLPSTRELSKILAVSRNSVIAAYDELKADGFLYSVNGKGTFVNSEKLITSSDWNIDWESLENSFSKTANELDIVKNEIPWSSDLISFKSISPDGDLFDMDEFKKSFMSRISVESHKLLNYGYAQGYKPLIDFLGDYMKKKGSFSKSKTTLVTNGFTEAFDLILSSFTKPGDMILCENPTHNTSIKIMRAHGINIQGIDIGKDGLDFDMLENILEKHGNSIKFAYLTPSYHNPTGSVMPPESRLKFYNLMKKYSIPIIEDGFNEELLYSSSHIFPLSSFDTSGNGVIYIGSFSKILFPGMRIGWIYADKKIINRLISVKRCRNIHTSFLDQGVLFDYLNSGKFEKYIKKIRKVYGEKFSVARKCVEKYIDNKYILGDGGLHIFIKLKGIDARELLDMCYNKKVIFMPGDIFFTDNNGYDTLRLGLSRLSLEDIEKGIKIIGETIDEMNEENK